MRYYENVEKTAENRLPQRAYYIPEGTADFLLLNGVWDFQYFENGDRVKPDDHSLGRKRVANHTGALLLAAAGI